MFGFKRKHSRPRKLLAVDMDSRHLRVVLATASAGRTRLKQFASVPLDADETLTPAQLGQRLGRLLQDEDLPAAPLVMAVPRGKSVLKPLRLPPGTEPDEVAAMVQFQVHSEIPFPPEQTVLDHSIEGEGVGLEADGVDVLAAAVRGDLLDDYHQIAEQAGLKLHRLGLRPYANVRCLEVAGQAREDTVALVHLTADETEIDVLVGTHLAFSRSAVVDLSAGQGQAPVEAVVSEIERSLQGFSAMRDGSKVDRILVAGGTGIEGELVQAIPRLLDTPAERFNPAGALGIESPSDVSAYITAVGLACGARSPDKQPFDFLNPKRPPEPSDPHRRRRLAVAVGAGMLLLASIIGSYAYLDGLSEEVARGRRQKRRLAEQRDDTEALIQRVDPIIEWHEQAVPWLDHLANLSRLLPGPGDVYIGDLRTGPDFMQFTARSRDGVVVDRLVKDLQDAGYAPKINKDGLDEDSPFGYVRHTELTVYLPDELPGEIAAEAVPPRPADDDLDRPLNEARRQSRRIRRPKKTSQEDGS